MSIQSLFSQIKKIHQRLNGSTLEFDLSNHHKILDQINDLKPGFSTKSDRELKNIARQLEMQVRKSGDLDAFLVDVYALVREVFHRMLQLDPFDVQLLGGIVLNQGKLVEMQTGEGKTLTAVFPVCLNAFCRKGVHILTFNDYLAQRDALWMGPVYEFLGFSVAFVREGMHPEDRKKAYDADITYLTAKEAGFDFLRDNLCYQPEHIVQREFNFAIIDEADSILIDEARTPLVIAGTSDESITDLTYVAYVAKKLQPDFDFEFDAYSRNILLTETGLKRVEKRLRCGNLYAKKNVDLLICVNCALHAEFLLTRDIDYIVRNGKIELVDEFTGRVADRRRWPDGLQAALEAKENLPVQAKGNILNSISLQHFLQNYPKLAGMTATAQAAEAEFREFYQLDIVVIPPNKTTIRQDFPDCIFATKTARNNALLKEIRTVHQTRQPILVGTSSVRESSELVQALQEQGIECQVLNAKNDAFEAEIVAQAGRLGAVTISTNMAGRGVDIKLGGSDEAEKEQVVALAGLYVLGTNKHESPRIDRQLQGRAGRQGDPGSSRFFISLEDDLFIKYRLQELLPKNLKSEFEMMPLKHPRLQPEIERVQRIVQGQNLEIKKTLTQYSNLIEKQRMVIFQQRQEVLENGIAFEYFKNEAPDEFHKLQQRLSREKLAQICQQLYLFQLDEFWLHYLADIADLREGIHLTRLGGQNPLFEFQKWAIQRFGDWQNEIHTLALSRFKKIKLSGNSVDLTETGLKIPSATWTYLINDNPFENMLGVQIMGDLGLAIGAGVYGPLLMIYNLIKNWRDSQKGK